MDAYRISGARLYLAKAEELLERCIHPNDHIDSFRLDDAEYRWSYLVFLQIVGKYLNLKRELGEIDYHYCYARESLLAYASWMDKNERPYKEILTTYHSDGNIATRTSASATFSTLQLSTPAGRSPHAFLSVRRSISIAA